MGETLKVIRDLTIIIAIYLYFIAWVYVHFYYEQFGISTNSVKIDYNSYLMYSYNVVTSSKFLSWAKGFCLVVFLIIFFLLVARWLKGKYELISKLHASFAGSVVVIYIKKFKRQYTLLLVFIISVIIFPQLFQISRSVAIQNYTNDRYNTHQLKTVQFIFRKNVDLLSPAIGLDSSLSHDNMFYADISVIKNDSDQLLRLLGESDNYYIVLQQRPFRSSIKALPSGCVYFIDKKDILLTKVILRSLSK